MLTSREQDGLLRELHDVLLLAMNRAYPYDEEDDHTYLPSPYTQTGLGRKTLQFGCAFESRNTVKHPVSKIMCTP